MDVWRSATLPMVRQLAGLESGLALKVLKRGAHPGGGGEVHLTVPIVARLPPVTLTDEGACPSDTSLLTSVLTGQYAGSQDRAATTARFGESCMKYVSSRRHAAQGSTLPPALLKGPNGGRTGMVKRIRGVAYSMRVSPQTSNRLVDGARGVLNALLADVYVFTDHMAGAEAGASPGYGLALVAETTAGRLLSAEAVSPRQLQARKCKFPDCLLQARPGCSFTLRLLSAQALVAVAAACPVSQTS